MPNENVFASAKIKFNLFRVRLNNGGYDSKGHYYGSGPRLYNATAEIANPGGPNKFDDIYLEFRAEDRESAKAYIQQRYPNAVFYN